MIIIYFFYFLKLCSGVAELRDQLNLKRRDKDGPRGKLRKAQNNLYTMLPVSPTTALVVRTLYRPAAAEYC